MHSLRRLISAVALVALIATPALAGTPESAVRQFLVTAYEGRFEALPKTAGARMERFERQVRNTLRVRCIRADQIALSIIAADAARATIHADVGVSKSDPLAVPIVWSSMEIVPFRAELVREGDRWLVSDIQNRDEEWADHLLAQKPEEREMLLRRQPERISKGLARALYAHAMAYLNSTEFTRGPDAAALARRVAQEAGDRGGEALALGATAYASVYNRISEEPNANVSFAKESLAIAQSVGDPDVLARAWYDRGRHTQPSRWAEARPAPASDVTPLECYQKAIPLAERAEDPTILTRVLYSLANLAANAQSDYLTARHYIDRALAIARDTDDLNAEASLESVLTTIYLNQRDVERGLFHNTRALELAKKAGAFGYPSLQMRSANLLMEAGQLEEASRVLARVLTRSEKGMASKVGMVTASALADTVRTLAVIEAERGNLGEAECLIRESHHMHGASPDAFVFMLAPYHAARGDHTAALALSLGSLASKGLYTHHEVAAYMAAGRAYRALGNNERALDMALEAIAVRETIDSRVAGTEQQRALASSATSECYELAAELTLACGDPARALAFLERGRARVLTEILEHGRPGAMAEADAALRRQQDALESEVTRISAALDRARITGRKRAIGQLTAELGRARNLRGSFVDGLQARIQRQQSTRRRVDRDEIDGLAKRLPPRTVALEYFVTDHELHIFVIGAAGRPQRILAQTRRIERAALERHVRDLVDKLAGNDLRVEAAARDVYRLLIEPVENDIAGADALLIVPDEILWRVPFAALMDRRGRFLVQRAATVYAPSLTAFTAIASSTKGRSRETDSLLAIGNPTLDPSAVKEATSFYRDAALGPLPDAEREVDAVLRLYDRRHSVVLKQDRATETRTKTALVDATVAHFATHALLDDGNPMYSRLMLARGGENAENGWLEGWEVARLNLKADLVVLSACETAHGQIGGGEGVIGLSWAFFLAGAHSILASEWKVASDSTADLMIGFHRALRAATVNPPLHKAQSLRKAQLQLLGNAKTSHPFHWAGFVLMGDPGGR